MVDSDGVLVSEGEAGSLPSSNTGLERIPMIEVAAAAAASSEGSVEEGNFQSDMPNELSISFDCIAFKA